jgi:hypothetical protein
MFSISLEDNGEEPDVKFKLQKSTAAVNGCGNFPGRD